ncbi:MAG: sugar phosphate isomerase/epimerase [Ruminococcaceae bacterium]|nr:sugar phosphate isomerase/epimerase [Oscillospiraceae bacterium]
MRISVSSYSFQQYIRAGKMTQLDTIAAAHELGLDAIEFTDIIPPEGRSAKEQAVALRKEADRLGMTVNAYTVGANLFQPTPEAEAAELSRLKEQVDIAVLLGARVMRHDVCYRLTGEGAGRSFDLMLPTLAKNARIITEYAAARGVRTCSENHGYIAQDSDRVERLVNAVAHDNYGVLVDIGNFACADEDSVTAVSRLAGLAVHAHAKDFYKRPFSMGAAEGYFSTRGCNYLKGAAIGEGDIPVEQCIAILRRAGYDGFLSIEYEGSEDALTGIKKGMENLKRYLS